MLANLLESIVKLSFVTLGLILMLFCMAVKQEISPTAYSEPIDSINAAQGKFKMSEEVRSGKVLFKQNCASCHNKNMKDDLTGPALNDLDLKWERKDLIEWIKNSNKLIKEGHPRAIQLIKKWKVEMPAFQTLTDEEIEHVIEYIAVESSK